MGFWKCVIYLCVTGTVGFFGGRMISKKQFNPSRGIFRCHKWEQGGKIYEKLSIRKWHKRLPDMSRILPFMMPQKNLSGDYAKRLPEMISETCVAEIVHIAISLMGLYCLHLWPGAGSVVIVLLHSLLLNLPFIIIQRYNRPRLIRLQDKLQKSKTSTERSCNPS